MGKESKTRQNAASEKSSGKTARKILIALLVIAFAGVGIFGLLAESGLLMGSITAFEVGGQKISARDYKIFYKTAEMNLINNYGTTLQMYYGVDLTKPLETQAYGDGTWGDYLHTSAQSAVAQTYILYQEALDNGYELAGEDDPAYKGQMAVYRATAELYDMSLEDYVKTVYGSGVKPADLENAAKVAATARNYYNDYIAGLNIGDSEIADYYENDKLAFDAVDYRSFTFPYETVKYTEPAEGEEVKDGEPASQEEADRMTQDNIDAAQAKADEFLSKITDEQSFIALAREYASAEDAEKYADDDATLTSGTSLSTASNSKILTWCAEDDRAEGDTTTSDSGSGIVVLYFLNRYLPEEQTVTVRHILIRAAEPSDTATDEEKTAAQEKLDAAKSQIEEIYAQWKDGDMNEDSFAELAYEYSQDSGSVANGGLIENFSEGDMVAEFDEWAFDPSRRAGDTGIVKTTYGYHLIYFVENGAYKWQATAKSDIENDKFDTYYSELSAKYPTKTHNYGLTLAY